MAADGPPTTGRRNLNACQREGEWHVPATQMKMGLRAVAVVLGGGARTLSLESSQLPILARTYIISVPGPLRGNRQQDPPLWLHGYTQQL